MNRTVSRRIEQLEARTAAPKRVFLFRIVLVHPEKGATNVLVLESGKPDRKEPPTREETEDVRADLEQRRAARLKGNFMNERQTIA